MLAWCKPRKHFATTAWQLRANTHQSECRLCSTKYNDVASVADDIVRYDTDATRSTSKAHCDRRARAQATDWVYSEHHFARSACGVHNWCNANYTRC